MLWRHRAARSLARAYAADRIDSHAFADGALISACTRVMADDARLEAGEREGDRRCGDCERAIKTHGGDIPFGVINVDLSTHGLIQDEALSRGRSIREVSDDLIRRMLAAAGCP